MKINENTIRKIVREALSEISFDTVSGAENKASNAMSNLDSYSEGSPVQKIRDFLESYGNNPKAQYFLGVLDELEEFIARKDRQMTNFQDRKGDMIANGGR